uniref:DRBM domain-containing protein n=1 Tax=Plectus sambesii TaxID=2011161 RepID=A0A914WKG8_9BILA
MANDVKNWIYIWSSKRKWTPPTYTFSDHRPVKANGARSNQPDQFSAEMRLGTLEYIAKGESKSKKEAQTLAAKDMVKHLLSTGMLTKEVVITIPGCADLVAESSKETVTAPLNKLEAVKVSYGRWQGGELTRDGKVLLESGDANELRKRKIDMSDEDGKNDVIHAQKKIKVAAVEKAEIVNVTTIDSGDDQAEEEQQQPSTSRVVTSQLSVGMRIDTGRKSESPEIVEVKGTSPKDNDDDVIEEEMIASMISVDKLCQQLRTKFPEQFKKFDDDIWLHWRRNGQDDETFQWKMKVRKALLDRLQMLIPSCRLFAVGSTINGCGSYNSDMDLCLTVPDSYVGFDTEREYAIDVLKQVQYFLRRQGHNLVKRVQLIPAKVPILKLALHPPYHELEIDINCNNVAGIHNSHLLHYYAKADDRFAAICLIVKHWAINAGINDAMTGTFNSYSLILLVLHYLQCVPSPPVLPNLQMLFPAQFTGQEEPYGLQLFQDFPAPIPGLKTNKQSVGELLVGFFDYYSRFDFDTTAISIRRGNCFDRSDLPRDTDHFKIYIEEPFDGKNTARCVIREEKMHRIRSELKRAINQLKNKGPLLECIKVTV